MDYRFISFGNFESFVWSGRSPCVSLHHASPQATNAESTNKTIIANLKKRGQAKGRWPDELRVLWLANHASCAGKTPFALTYGTGGDLPKWRSDSVAQRSGIKMTNRATMDNLEVRNKLYHGWRCTGRIARHYNAKVRPDGLELEILCSQSFQTPKNTESLDRRGKVLIVLDIPDRGLTPYNLSVRCERSIRELEDHLLWAADRHLQPCGTIFFCGGELGAIHLFRGDGRNPIEDSVLSPSFWWRDHFSRLPRRALASIAACYTSALLFGFMADVLEGHALEILLSWVIKQSTIGRSSLSPADRGVLNLGSLGAGALCRVVARGLESGSYEVEIYRHMTLKSFGWIVIVPLRGWLGLLICVDRIVTLSLVESLALIQGHKSSEFGPAAKEKSKYLYAGKIPGMGGRNGPLFDEEIHPSRSPLFLRLLGDSIAFSEAVPLLSAACLRGLKIEGIGGCDGVEWRSDEYSKKGSAESPGDILSRNEIRTRFTKRLKERDQTPNTINVSTLGIGRVRFLRVNEMAGKDEGVEDEKAYGVEGRKPDSHLITLRWLGGGLYDQIPRWEPSRARVEGWCGLSERMDRSLKVVEAIQPQGSGSAGWNLSGEYLNWLRML
ncbi:hypothetical protein FNV43_RR10888 [Rhamnella rubrinervis]|uniref:Uncharacterized protein n=1 Tax=Rhamnella rubrinervis TaxID=2594499 RepID=A0A8K0H4L5_9ROSA|nr:hypothetical protein FNV43_RR10888 [Rhamnella rubrinervis]